MVLSVWLYLNLLDRSFSSIECVLGLLSIQDLRPPLFKALSRQVTPACVALLEPPW